MSAHKGLRFLVGTGLIGGVSYFLLGFVMPLLENVTAMLSAGILSFFGSSSAAASIVIYNTLKVQVIPLCVGDIEIAILVGAILSTADRKWNDRIIGVIGAFVFVMLANAMRIALTMLAWEAYGIGAIEFIHSSLFRVTLVVAIVGFYAFWYLRDLVWEKLKLSRLLSER